MKYIIIAAIVPVIVAIVVLLAQSGKSERGGFFESPEKRAGRNGEKYATHVIKQCLDSDDLLLTNVCVQFEGKRTELDNLIINRSGVYIIEVKTYRGRLFGGADDYEWEKYKVTNAGNVYEKTVKNPIKQVHRQIYVLANYLKSRGIRVWVNGYAFLWFITTAPFKAIRCLKARMIFIPPCTRWAKAASAPLKSKMIRDALD
ncbi:MAG: NERD domain-containing protein [Anaerotruncus sp.]|nr:MAG: NERD domain-containing protein [Anaerotruncus sp.]